MFCNSLLYLIIFNLIFSFKLEKSILQKYKDLIFPNKFLFTTLILLLDNIIKISSINPLNIQLKNINNEDIKNNNEKIKNLNILNGNLFGNIKSIYFSRILFSHLDEKIKLKVIKYNKKLQNNLDIKLINYKLYSGKYIIYETKFKGKEYDGYNNNDLIFEGEYLNGEKNGKGKEYNNDGK